MTMHERDPCRCVLFFSNREMFLDRLIHLLFLPVPEAGELAQMFL